MVGNFLPRQRHAGSPILARFSANLSSTDAFPLDAILVQNKLHIIAFEMGDLISAMVTHTELILLEHRVATASQSCPHPEVALPAAIAAPMGTAGQASCP